MHGENEDGGGGTKIRGAMDDCRALIETNIETGRKSSQTLLLLRKRTRSTRKDAVNILHTGVLPAKSVASRKRKVDISKSDLRHPESTDPSAEQRSEPVRSNDGALAGQQYEDTFLARNARFSFGEKRSTHRREIGTCMQNLRVSSAGLCSLYSKSAPNLFVMPQGLSERQGLTSFRFSCP
jgi:hypothetical protein